MSGRPEMQITGITMILIAWMQISGRYDWWNNHPKMGGNVMDSSGLTSGCQISFFTIHNLADVDGLAVTHCYDLEHSIDSL